MPLLSIPLRGYTSADVPPLATRVAPCIQILLYGQEIGPAIDSIEPIENA
jgi:hypothetical protein